MRGAQSYIEHPPESEGLSAAQEPPSSEQLPPGLAGASAAHEPPSSEQLPPAGGVPEIALRL